MLPPPQVSDTLFLLHSGQIYLSLVPSGPLVLDLGPREVTVIHAALWGPGVVPALEECKATTVVVAAAINT